MRKIFLLGLQLCSLAILNAQEWKWAKDIGKYYTGGRPPVVKTNNAGDLYTSGTFTGEAKLGSTTFFVDTLDYSSHSNYFARFNTNGSLVWAREIKGVNTYLLDISFDKANNAYALGYYANELILEDTTLANSQGIFLIAYDAGGHRRWIKTYTDISGFFSYCVNDENNDILVASTIGDPKAVVVRKVSPLNGADIWKKTFAMDIPGDFALRGLQVNKSNQVFFHTAFNGSNLSFDGTLYPIESKYTESSVLARLTSNGATQQVIIVKGATVSEIDFDAQNNIYMIGSYVKEMKLGDTTMTTDICDEHNCGEYFMARLEASGDLDWARKMEDSYTQAGISVADNGDFFYAGNFSSSITFDDVTLNETATRAALFIYKFNRNGVAQWAQKDGGGYLAGSHPFDVAYSENKSIYVNGHFHNFYAQNWFGTDTLPRNTSFKSHIFLAKMTDAQVSTGIEPVPVVESDLFEVSPNPSNGSFVINMSRIPPQANICVYDMLGNCVSTKTPLTHTGQRVNLMNYAKGMYLVEVSAGGMKLVKKVSVE